MNVHEIALAGLLHDIGKFLQRANDPGEGLSERSQNLKGTLCPSYKGHATHYHVLYTNEFVENRPFWPNGIEPGEVINLAAYHHRPDTDERDVIARADRLSSGMEREYPEPGEDVGPAHFRKTRLQSVASTVGQRISGTSATPIGLRPLSPRYGFPLSDEGTDRSALTSRYSQLWSAFEREWDNNRGRTPGGFINRACSVLERFTWCIPSATNAVPDISLYDHLKTTSAIGVCLHEAGGREEPFLLVGGDLPGIQRYIFGFSGGTGGLAKRLRARSFDVECYSDSVSLHILNHLGLPLTHRILFAGGKFQLLLPNTDKTRAILADAHSSASEWLFDRTAGELSLALAQMPISCDDLDTFSECAREMTTRLRNEKQRPGATHLKGEKGWNTDRFLLPALQTDEDTGICASCGHRSGPIRESGDPVCDICRADVRRGSRLPKSRFVAHYPGGEGASSAPMGSYSLTATPDEVSRDPLLLVDMDGKGAEESPHPVTASFRARHVPRHEDGSVVTFEEIAARSMGRSALGYLKMDVDNLGFIFAQGMKGETADRTSISRVAALSRTLEMFFSGYVEVLLRDEFPSIYLVYAGGDDLLAIGPWNQTFQLATRIRDDFRSFTGENPAWSLSAGIAVTGHHTPVLRAVEEADRRLEASKNLSGEGIIPWPTQDPADAAPEKDRITAFGTSVPWDTFPRILNNAQVLRVWIADGVISSGQVRRLMRYGEMYRRYQRTGHTRHLQYAPLLVRDLRRNWDEDTEQQREAKKWASSLATPDSREMKALGFLCHYALNATREHNGEE